MKMDEKRKEAQIVAFYLSKFDKTALKNLGYTNNSQAFKEIGNILGVLPNYIKLSRDEFDVVHPHRKGWHKRPLSPATKTIISKFESLDEYSLRSIIIDILDKNKTPDTTKSIENIVSVISSEEEKKSPEYTSRGITGKKAENFFMKWIKNNTHHFDKNEGLELIDMRENGCGYDFKIKSNKEELSIEVKGILSENGSILFTQKEWEIAEKLREKYYLVIITNIENEKYKVKIINDPFGSFNPTRNIVEIIQTSWSISGNELKIIPHIQ